MGHSVSSARRRLTVLGGVILLATILVGPGLGPAFASTTWTATEAPLPANAAAASQSVNFQAVSCPTVNWCVGVGSYDDCQRRSKTDPFPTVEN